MTGVWPLVYFWVNPSIVITNNWVYENHLFRKCLLIYLSYFPDFYVGFRKKNPTLREEVLACSVFARFISIENIFIENLLEFKITF